MRTGWIALLGLGLLAPRPALAQPSPPPLASAVVPPTALAPLRADYPPGATGDATVTLVLTVNADGSVRSARLALGAEPFAAAALAASTAWKFTPATRDGAPLAAAIKAEIHFTAPVFVPAPDPVPASAPASASASAPPPPPPPPPLEVTVRGERPSPGSTTLSRAEVRLLPGAFGDPFRAVEILPGVTPLASGVPFFFVRGAPPGNVGYFLDGIRVPLLYHLGLGPSVVHPAIVDRVDLYPGGYPARFGRFAGGIVSGETRDPDPVLHGEATLRLVDAGALVETPFADGHGQALVAGRYSYTAALLSLVQSAVDVRYWDYQARVGYDLGPRDRVTLFAFGSYDYLGQKNALPGGGTSTSTLFDTTFHRVDLRYEHRLGPDSYVRQAVTLGFDETGFDADSHARDRMLSARSELVHRVSPELLLRAGADAIVDDIQIDLSSFTDDKSFTSQFSSHVEFTGGVRADAVWDVTPRLEVVPGLRVDVYGSNGQTRAAVDPRLSSRVAITPWMRLLSTFGLASQPPSFILPGPGFSEGIHGPLQRSAQSSLGVEMELPSDVQATATAYYSAFFDLTDALGTSRPSATDFSQDFSQRSLGSSVGLELTLRRRLTRKLGGFLSYTLARAERYVIRPVLDSLTPPRVATWIVRNPSTYDRTHTFNLAVGYDFGKGYKAGARVVAYSGTPIVPESNGFGAPPVISGRLPPFFRLDLRLEKRWIVGVKHWLSLVLEVQNATLSKEVLGITCKDGPCREETLGPVTIPSLGLEGGL